MRRRLLAALVGLVTAITINAQSFTYRYCSPELLDAKLITASNGPVNIRKAANASAPLLNRICPMEGPCMLTWDGKKTIAHSDFEPYRLEQGVFVPSTKDAGGFWEVQVPQFLTGEPITAYVSKSVTKAVDLEPLTMNDLIGRYDFFPITKGKYAGLVIAYEDLGEGWGKLMVGMLHNGKLIFSHSTEHDYDVYLTYDSEYQGFKCTETEARIEVTYGTGISMRRSDGSGPSCLDVNKLTDEQKRQLLLTLKADKNPNACIVYGKTGNEIICTYNSNPDVMKVLNYNEIILNPKKENGLTVRDALAKGYTVMVKCEKEDSQYGTAEVRLKSPNGTMHNIEASFEYECSSGGYEVGLQEYFKAKGFTDEGHKAITNLFLTIDKDNMKNDGAGYVVWKDAKSSYFADYLIVK